MCRTKWVNFRAGRYAAVSTESNSLCLAKQLTSRWTFLWTLVKSDDKTFQVSQPRCRRRTRDIFLPHKVAPPNRKLKQKERRSRNLQDSPPLFRIRDFFFLRRKEKKSISAKFIHGFLRSMQVHLEGLGGTRFIPVKVFEGELPLMLFSLPLRS